MISSYLTRDGTLLRDTLVFRTPASRPKFWPRPGLGQSDCGIGLEDSF